MPRFSRGSWVKCLFNPIFHSTLGMWHATCHFGMHPLKIEKIERSETLKSRVSEHLENLIVQNRLAPGGRIPTERELAARFDVSRTVIREAVSGLVAKGMLKVNPGSGTVVRRPSAKHVSRTMSFYLAHAEPQFDTRSITEVRRLLEVEIAGVAAERRTQEDLAELRKILDGFESARHRMDTFVQWDLSFHLGLARATHNELLALLLDSIGGVMTRVREIGYQVPGTNDQALRFHTIIYQQVELGSREGARQAMREHIESSESVMNAALARTTKT